MDFIPDEVKEEIDRTITKLKQKKFDPDPIAGAHFSRVTSVMSSAYKRHGFILERAILESVRRQSEYIAWEDRIMAKAIRLRRWRVG